MHIEYLYYFKDFAKTLSISKTAERYFMTPQGLSRALHQMEKDFGITLMRYQNNTVSLTPAGEALSRRVDSITQLYDEARGALTEFKLAEVDSTSEVVRITVTSCASQYLITMLGLQKPGMFPFNVKMTESNLYRIVPNTAAREDEDAFCVISLPDTTKWREHVDRLIVENEMIYLPLLKTPLAALVSVYSSLAKKGMLSAQDIDPYPVARFRDDVLGDALDDYVREDNVKTVTNATSVIYTQIIEHQAVGFAPKLIEGMRTLPDAVVTRPVEGFFDTEFGLLIGRKEADSPRVKQVSKSIMTTLRKEKEGSRYGNTFELLC